MSQKDPIIFGKQKLVFNSAKNKYDSDDEIDDVNIVNNRSEGSVIDFAHSSPPF